MIRAVVTLKAEILVDVESGTYAEEKARRYLMVHPEALKLITLSCEVTKIKRLLKEQSDAYSTVSSEKTMQCPKFSKNSRGIERCGAPNGKCQGPYKSDKYTCRLKHKDGA